VWRRGLAAWLLSAGCTLVNHVNQVRFVDGGVPAFFDDFDSSTLKDGWTFGGGDGKYALENGHLRLETTTTSPNDFCGDGKLSCLRMLRPALPSGASEVYQARFDGPPPVQVQWYGLMPFDGAQHYLYYLVGETGVNVLQVLGGPDQPTEIQKVVPTPSIDLRVTNDASGFRFEYRTGSAVLWDAYGTLPSVLGPLTQVGLALSSSNGPSS
jgi:hypothetical protein